jgi:hypothetical protein
MARTVWFTVSDKYCITWLYSWFWYRQNTSTDETASLQNVTELSWLDAQPQINDNKSKDVL